MATDVIDLQGTLRIQAPDGSAYEIQPGPRGKGVALRPVPVHEKGEAPKAPGRPPRPSTQRLRELLVEHATSGDVASPSAYVNWLAVEDPHLPEDRAKQVVYRELRGLREGKAEAGSPAAGRKPSALTHQLRVMLDGDLQKGRLKAPRTYVKWVLKRRPGMAKQAAQQLVYRERAKRTRKAPSA